MAAELGALRGLREPTRQPEAISEWRMPAEFVVAARRCAQDCACSARRDRGRLAGLVRSKRVERLHACSNWPALAYLCADVVHERRPDLQRAISRPWKDGVMVGAVCWRSSETSARLRRSAVAERKRSRLRRGPGRGADLHPRPRAMKDSSDEARSSPPTKRRWGEREAASISLTRAADAVWCSAGRLLQRSRWRELTIRRV